MTVPNMVPDIRTLIRRRNLGQSVPVFPASYSPEDYPDFNKMDEVELMQFRQELAEDMENKRFELHQATKELEKKQKEEDQPLT